MYLRSFIHLKTILGFELAAIFFQRLLNILDLLRRQQRWWSRSPLQLTKLFKCYSFQNSSLERPQPISIIHLLINNGEYLNLNGCTGRVRFLTL